MRTHRTHMQLVARTDPDERTDQAGLPATLTVPDQLRSWSRAADGAAGQLEHVRAELNVCRLELMADKPGAVAWRLAGLARELTATTEVMSEIDGGLDELAHQLGPTGVA